MKNLDIFKYVLSYYFGWILILSLVTFFGLSTIPHYDKPYHLKFADSSTEYWIGWANWDGGHFRGIAENGYLHPFQVVFFPLYPLLIKALMFLGIHSLWAGLIISQISTLAALFYLFKLAQLDYPEDIAKKSIFLILAFPTSFYLSALYSESLFLALALASFYFARNKKWWLASILAGLSTVTRLAGIAVIVAIAFEYYLKNVPKFKFEYLWKKFIFRLIFYATLVTALFEGLKNLFFENKFWVGLGVGITLTYFINEFIFILISLIVVQFLAKYGSWRKIFTYETLWFISSLIPLILYMFYLKQTQGDFLAFVNYENHWDRVLTYPWQAPINFYNNLASSNFFVVGITHQILIEFLFFIFFLIIFILSLYKQRFSYNIYFGLSIIIPITSGTLEAIHRYALVIFPIILALANIKYQIVYKLWIILSLVFLGIFSVLFFNSYWVS